MTAADGIHARRAELTPRELEVLDAITRRSTNAEIATALQLSKRTVEAHVSALYRKLGVSTRRALIATAGTASDEPDITDASRGRIGAARAAFEHAVLMERAAIETHEAAARRLDRLAAELEADAVLDRDPRLRARALAVVARARRRAGAARQRAEVVRQRLHDEGVSTD